MHVKRKTVWFASTVVLFWVGADVIVEQFAVLSMNTISRVKMVIMFALGKSCIFGLVVRARSVEDAFWCQHDGAAANSQGACLAAASVANRSVEAMSFFPCLIRLNESVI